MKFRKDNFAKVKRLVNKNALFMLNIYELESLILADIAVFNDIFKTNIEYINDPMNIKMPKELLKEKSLGRFRESDNPEIFSKLDLKKLKIYHKAFKSFCKKLDMHLIIKDYNLL